MSNSDDLSWGATTLWVIYSVAMFCFVFLQKFRLLIGLHSSGNISPTAGEARQTIPTNYRDRVDEAQCTNNKCAEKRKHRAHRLVERTSWQILERQHASQTLKAGPTSIVTPDPITVLFAVSALVTLSLVVPSWDTFEGALGPNVLRTWIHTLCFIRESFIRDSQ